MWDVRDDVCVRDIENPKGGVAKKAFSKHEGAVCDSVMSATGEILLTAGNDNKLRLWDATADVCFGTMKGHTDRALSATLSVDSRQIVSCSADGSIRLWNTLGEEKYSLGNNAHKGWVNSVRFSPVVTNPLIISGGEDGSVKVWDLQTMTLSYDFLGHTGPVLSVVISPDGSLCATGGLDGTARLWDLESSSFLECLEAGSPIQQLAFSPNRYWLCAATDEGVKIWDLEKKTLEADIRLERYQPAGSDKVSNTEADLINVTYAYKIDESGAPSKNQTKVLNHLHRFTDRKQAPSKHLPWTTSLAWNPLGNTLFVGTQSGDIMRFSFSSVSA